MECLSILLNKQNRNLHLHCGFKVRHSNIQDGDEKYIEKLQKKIDRLIQNREKSILEENSNSS